MLSKRLSSLRESKGLTQKELSTRLGMARTTYSGYENGSREPDHQTLQKFANFFDVSTDYLLGRNALPEGATPYEPDNMIKLPILGTVRAGEPILMQNFTEGFELVEPELLRGRQGFVLRVKGNSMTGDRIYEGDLVVVICQEEVEASEIAVVSVDREEATLKRVKCQGGVCVLTSSNPDFEPYLFPSDTVHILGKVVRVIRDL